MTQPLTLESGKLTIGVAAHGNVGVTIECLKSIFASVSGDFELILVDDASPDDMISLFREAREYHPGTEIFRFPENKEYSHSVNCILTHARTEKILFISNDIFICPTYVKGLMDVMSNETIGIARGVSNFVDGFIDSPIHHVMVPDTLSSFSDMVKFSEEIFAGDRNLVTPDLFLTGDAFMVRADLAQQLGGFDTGFLGYFSDMDFGIRVAQAHYQRVVCGRAFAWHAQDANILYLSDAEREAKVLRRNERVAAAWSAFRRKWDLSDLPAEWQSWLLTRIPYRKLDELTFNEAFGRASRQDYSQYKLG